jgi:hypothetical protein
MDNQVIAVKVVVVNSQVIEAIELVNRDGNICSRCGKIFTGSANTCQC